MTPLLEIKNLKTRFYTQDGVVRAVNDVLIPWIAEKYWVWLVKAVVEKVFTHYQ